MRDYRKHLTLLPHKWQVVGIVASCIVLIPLYYLHYKLSVLLPIIWETQKSLPEYNALVPWANLTNILASVFLMICCLSKEKEEDEYTISVRYRALTIAVIVFFLSRAFGEMIYGGFHRISNGIFSVTFNLPVSDDPIRGHLIGSMGLVVLDRIVGFFSSSINTQLLYLILLKVLKKVGDKTGYDSILLPYRYKKIGWWMLPFSLLLFPLFAFILLYPVKDSTPDAISGPYHIIMRLIILLPYIAIIFICLSREKQEDEFIRHIRARILAYFAVYYLVASFVISRVIHVLAIAAIHVSPYGGPYIYAYQGAEKILPILIWVPLVALVYALVLRKVLSNNLKESNDEK